MKHTWKPKEIAEALNRQLERLMPVISPTGVVLGFLFPGVFNQLRPFVPWIFSLMTLSGALKLQARELGNSVRNPVPVLLYFVSAHVFMPFLVFFLAGIIFRGESDTIAGFVLLYASPAAVTAFIWVTIFRGDLALALALILLDTLVAPLVMPGTVFLLLGTKVVLDMTGIALSLALMVVLPTIVGVTANEISRGKIPALLCPCLNPLSKLLIILLLAANVSAVAPHVHLNSSTVWLILFFCIFFSIMGFVLAKLTGILARLNPRKKTSLFFIAGLRNTVAASTIAIAYFPEAAAQPAIFGIMFQQVMAVFMGKFLLRPEKQKGAGNGGD